MLICLGLLEGRVSLHYTGVCDKMQTQSHEDSIGEGTSRDSRARARTIRHYLRRMPWRPKFRKSVTSRPEGEK